MAPLEPRQAPPQPDDEVIGLALRRSLVVLVVLGILTGSAVWWLSRPAQNPESRVTPLQSPASAAASAGIRPPVARFTAVGTSAGITFVHQNGAEGSKLLPETMGGGVACLDFDGDGDADLLFINSGRWPGSRLAGPPPLNGLFRNDTVPGGDWKFTDVTAGSGLDRPFYGMGVACGDFDGDGRTDVLITGVGGVRLMRNVGDGRFEDVTLASGLPAESGDWATAAAWFDADNDGDLDLFVGRYVGWTPELDREVNNQLVGIGRAYGRPWNFPGTFPTLWRNDGAEKPGGIVRFTDVSAASGLRVKNPATGLPMAKTLAVVPIDINEDGWMDLVVANDTVQNFVFTNRHDGTFREIGAQSGVAFDAYGQTRGAMGIDAARFRNDRALGIAIGNFANEMNALYVSQPVREQMLFADEAITEGLGPASRLLLKFGLFFFDYDLDGRLDILTANGHIEEEIEKIQADVRYRQPAQLFWNAGGASTFTASGTNESGSDLFRPIVGRGSAYADFDGDGDLDVVLTQINGPPLLLRNDQALGNHWIRVRLEGGPLNREAIGAWVTVTTDDGRRLSRHEMPTKSYLSQSELPLTFGLGKSSARSAEVRWPDGTSSRHPVQLDRLNVLTKGR
jgi:enediyne biosynthesis protein E4